MLDRAKQAGAIVRDHANGTTTYTLRRRAADAPSVLGLAKASRDYAVQGDLSDSDVATFVADRAEKRAKRSRSPTRRRAARPPTLRLRSPWRAAATMRCSRYYSTDMRAIGQTADGQRPPGRGAPRRLRPAGPGRVLRAPRVPVALALAGREDDAPAADSM